MVEHMETSGQPQRFSILHDLVANTASPFLCSEWWIPQYQYLICIERCQALVPLCESKHGCTFQVIRVPACGLKSEVWNLI